MYGSIATSVYRSNVDVGALPAEPAAIASESIGGALTIAREVGGEAGAALVSSAGEAFTDAFTTTMAAGALVALLSGITVAVVGRRERRERAAAREPLEAGEVRAS